ncbi:MAG: RNA-binding cell elongation regulator Jag/EloR [Caldilineaceae bacterium]
MAMQAQEFRAKSVDEAIEEGLSVLRLQRDQVTIEVVHKGSRGIFGLGSEPAVVRITPRTPTTSSSTETSASSSSAPSAAVSSLPATPTTVTEHDEHSEAQSGEAESMEDDGVEESVGEERRDAEAAITPPTTVSAGNDLALEGSADSEQDEAPASSLATDTAEEDEEDEALAQLATELLTEMLHLMDFDAEVSASWQEETETFEDEDEDEGEVSVTERYLLLDVNGTDLGALIGRRGETLENIQYLLRLMVNQKLHQWKNIVVDVEHYKARRVTQLTQLATRMADQVSNTGRAISLEPMPASERRIVHMTLRDHPDVYTESHGDGPRRKVHIFAKS